MMTDLEKPTAIRRTVCFSQAILFGKAKVEDVTAVRAETMDDVRRILAAGNIPVLADPAADCRHGLRPDVLVDAILAKKNLGTKIDDAPLVSALGPGYSAGEDCPAVIEPMRGPRLGRASRPAPGAGRRSAWSQTCSGKNRLISMAAVSSESEPWIRFIVVLEA